LEELKTLVRTCEISQAVLQVDLRKVLDASDSTHIFLENIFTLFNNRSHAKVVAYQSAFSALLGLPRILEFLCLLNTKGFLLLNKSGLISVNSKGIDRRPVSIGMTLSHPSYSSKKKSSLAYSIYEEVKRASPSKDPNWVLRAHYRIWLLLRVTDIESLGDISSELLDFINTTLEGPIAQSSRTAINSINRQIAEAIIRLFQKDEGLSQYEFVPPHKLPGKEVKQRGSGRSRGFRWVEKVRPELKTWVDLLESFVNQKLQQCADPLISGFNRWLDYLLTLEKPPLCPEDVSRPLHINN
jgi:hypothetical protein